MAEGWRGGELFWTPVEMDSLAGRQLRSNSLSDVMHQEDAIFSHSGTLVHFALHRGLLIIGWELQPPVAVLCCSIFLSSFLWCYFL